MYRAAWWPQAGYPIRHTYVEAINRYRMLATEIPASGGAKDKENSIALFSKVLGEPSNEAGGWQVGSSKLFIKDSHDALLEEKRDEVFHSNALNIQRLIRGALARKRFIDMKAAMTTIQTRFRSHVAKEQGARLTNGFARLQVRGVFTFCGRAGERIACTLGCSHAGSTWAESILVLSICPIVSVGGRQLW
jgi:myosin-7